MRRDGGKADWWRPMPGGVWDGRVQFIAAAAGIVATAITLAFLTFALASTNDGRIKALVLWAIGTTVVIAFALYKVFKRENIETRYGRALSDYHQAHHELRDAAYARYIEGRGEAEWKPLVQRALASFSRACTIAVGASCHATIKEVKDRRTTFDNSIRTPDSLEVETFLRSADRPQHYSREGMKNLVGRNTDFRLLFNPETDDNRCWYCNDLLRLSEYENPHWPPNPKKRNIPYRSTMVWPIRKVMREGTPTMPSDLYIYGFLTLDTLESNAFDIERHFHLGAGFADHLLTVLWDPSELRELAASVVRGGAE